MANKLHKYRRFTTTKGKPFWRCVDPGCTHVIYQENLMIGRESRCWRCDESTIIKDMRQARPVCDSCKEDRKLSKIG